MKTEVLGLDLSAGSAVATPLLTRANASIKTQPTPKETKIMPPKATEKPEKAAPSKEKDNGASEKDAKAAATRMRDLEAAISTITKNYGDGSIMRLGDSYKVKIDIIPTGALALDMALGV